MYLTIVTDDGKPDAEYSARAEMRRAQQTVLDCAEGGRASAKGDLPDPALMQTIDLLLGKYQSNRLQVRP